jgi:hypothetical protein
VHFDPTSSGVRADTARCTGALKNAGECNSPAFQPSQTPSFTSGSFVKSSLFTQELADRLPGRQTRSSVPCPHPIAASVSTEEASCRAARFVSSACQGAQVHQRERRQPLSLLLTPQSSIRTDADSLRPRLVRRLRIHPGTDPTLRWARPSTPASVLQTLVSGCRHSSRTAACFASVRIVDTLISHTAPHDADLFPGASPVIAGQSPLSCRLPSTPY